VLIFDKGGKLKNPKKKPCGMREIEIGHGNASYDKP